MAANLIGKIVAMRKEGMTYAAITKATGIPAHVVFGACVAAGVNGSVRITDSIRDSVLSLRKKGFIIRDIAKKTGLSVQLVTDICKTAGVKKPKIQGTIREVRVRNAKFAERNLKMAAMREQGNTVTEIAESFGVSRQRVHQITGKMSRVYKTSECAVCGMVYLRKDRRWKGKHCSNKCGRKGMSIAKINTDAKWSRKGFVTLKCCGCGKEFERSNYIESISSLKNKSDRKYCSQLCYRTNMLPRVKNDGR